ncbi:MAG: protein kinase, partial [Chloroflexota bacterium]
LIADKKYTVTYVGYDLQTDQIVAVDILKREFLAVEPFASEYHKRMQILAQIEHPNLPKVYHVGRLAAGETFAVREYIAGYPLTERLEQLMKQGLPVYSIYALRLVRQVAEALVEAEQFKLYHYALAPENVLLKTFTMKSDDTVILLDMGIPSELPYTIVQANLNGERNYFAPEQQSQALTDGRSHVYSLGILLFELLTGERPLKDAAFWEPYIRPLVGSRTSLEKVREDLSPETYTLVNKCLRRESWQRFPSVSAFIEALDKAIVAEDVQIRAAADAIFLPRRTKRPFIVFIATIAIVASGGAFLIQGLINNTDNPTAVPTLTTATAAPLVLGLDETGTPSPTATTATEEAATVIEAATSAPSATMTATAEATATATPTATATATASPTPTATLLPTVRVVLSSASVRNGPSVNYNTIDFMLEGETAVVIARSTGADTWYNIILENGLRGWISGTVVESGADNNLADVPPAATIPAPPTPTNTPVPTQTPFPTPTPPEDGGGGSDRPPGPQATSTQPPLP